MRTGGHTASIAFSLLVAGCTSISGSNLPAQDGAAKRNARKPGEAYQLTAEERSLDCKRLTGRMQVRILQIRDASERNEGNALARGLQSLATPVLGGTTYGIDRDADFARHKAELEALNRQLADKNCATYDLDAELRPRSFRDTPTPVPKGSEAKRP